MFLFCCVLCLSPLLGVMSQVQLIQPTSEIKKPGDSVKIPCKASGYTFTDYFMNWVQQVPGRGLMWIGRLNPNSGETIYSSTFQGKVTISRDNSITTGYLQITSLTVGDTATYFCALYSGSYESYALDIWGPGTTVTVTSATQTAPSLFPLISCGTSQDSTVTIGCLAKDFLPDSISFSWMDKSNGSYTNGFMKYNSVLQSSGTYSATTQIKVASQSWDKYDPFYCVAKSAINTKNLKLVKREVSDPRRPKVFVNPPLKTDLESNGFGIIVCVAFDYHPKPLKITWLKDHKATTLHTETENSVPDGNGNFTAKSFITVPIKDWNEDAVFTCVVEHPGSGTVEMRNVSKSQVCDSVFVSGKIQIFAVAPSYETIYLENKAILTCMVTNLASKEDLQITWREVGSEKPLETTTENPIANDNHTYSATAVAKVCVDDWLQKKYECTVTHPELATPGKVLLYKHNGVEPKTPAVYVFPPHQDELNRKESVTLICLVKAFFPADIMVKWHNGESREMTNAINTDPIEENDPSKKIYFMYSKLTISFEEWNSGSSFTCLVAHESLSLHATQRSIDKTSGKPTSVNVTLHMSDSC